VPEIGSGLASIQRKLAMLKRDGAARVTRAIAQEAIAQSMACFRGSRNPYGEAWAPLKHRKGKPLLDTGRGRQSVAVSDLEGVSFRLGTNVRYMHFHQDGVDKTYTRKASGRFQATNKRGRFIAKSRAASSKAKSVGFRRLNYKGGEVHLVIPQRAFLPIRGRGLGVWDAAFKRVALGVMKKIDAGG
jgi:phage gpG-like protein